MRESGGKRERGAHPQFQTLGYTKVLEERECDGAKVVDAEGCFVVGDALEADGERLFAKGPAIF